MQQELIPLTDFIKAYKDCRKHKRRTDSQIEFEINLESNLIKLCDEVNNGTYEIGKSICFCVTKPKLREVFAASFRDRIVHHIIMQRLEPLFENVFIADNYNCRKGKGVLYGVKRLNEKMALAHRRYGKKLWIGKFDFKSFFMTINKAILLERLLKFIDERYEGVDKTILKRLVSQNILHRPELNCEIHGDRKLFDLLPEGKSLFKCKPGLGLPIGNLTSQMFASFYLYEFDILMRRRFKGFYGRYVDDIYVLGKKEDIVEAVGWMKDYLYDNLKVILNMNKVYIQPYWHGVKFIGSVVKNGRIYISNSTTDNMDKRITLFNNTKDKEDVDKVISSLNSYLGIMQHHKAYAIKRKMIEKLDKFWWNYMHISGDYQKLSKTKDYGYSNDKEGELPQNSQDWNTPECYPCAVQNRRHQRRGMSGMSATVCRSTRRRPAPAGNPQVSQRVHGRTDPVFPCV